MNFHVYKRRVNYHETDAMSVLHHSNHIKYFEEARVAFIRDLGVLRVHAPYGKLVFAVVNLSNRFFKPAQFDDDLEVWTQSKTNGLRVHFQYAIYSHRLQSIIADGTTELVPINEAFKPTKLPPEVMQAYQQATWSESWPPQIEK